MSNIFNLGVCVCVYVCTHTRAKSFSHVRLCDRIDCSRQGPLSMGILQAKILEWVAMPSSRGSFQPRSLALQVDSLPSEPPRKLYVKQLNDLEDNGDTLKRRVFKAWGFL